MYSGAMTTPECTGVAVSPIELDQINLTIPSGITSSCLVRLKVSAGGKLPLPFRVRITYFMTNTGHGA